MDSHKGQEKKKRLIVLLPVCMANDFELAHMIHWMAYQKNCDVFYMTVAESNDNSLALSRDMATLKAVTAGNGLQRAVDPGQPDRLACPIAGNLPARG